MSAAAAAPSAPSLRSERRKRRAFSRAVWATRALFGAAAIGAVQFVRTPVAARAPFAELGLPSAWASPDAFGASGEVNLRFALPGGDVAFPLAVDGDPASLRYRWVALGDSLPSTEARAFAGALLVAPTEPGFYHLELIRGHNAGDTLVRRELMDAPALAVMVPFAEKTGSILNGYKIGVYLAERFGGRHEEPEGFLEVRPEDLALSVSKHFRLGDFITHDTQADVWPKYVALSPRLLDKLELVVSEIAQQRGDLTDAQLALDVHSGFRTPAHNAQVERAARDSRHQYGDAADIVMDANGDGRITSADGSLVASAVDQVERKHPDLVGGVGLYTSERYRTPYVHIDARGRRSRWRG